MSQKKLPKALILMKWHNH